MDLEQERVGERSSNEPKSRKRKSLAASSSPAPAPRRVATKKKPRRKRDEDADQQFSLADPGILAQKEENGKVYYLCNWADIDPDTGEQYKPTWVRDNFSGQ
jgi:hypothetical protein